METLKLDRDEHIEFISCSFSHHGLHSLTLKTTKNQLLMAEGETKLPGLKSVDINLSDFSKVVVGFRTGFNENMEMMAVYTMSRLDVEKRAEERPTGLSRALSLKEDDQFDYLRFEGILRTFTSLPFCPGLVALRFSMPEYWSKLISSSSGSCL